jgi:hypothetical protein
MAAEEPKEEDQGSRDKGFLRRVAERIGLIFANPMITLWDSARREERRRKQDY